MYKILRNHSTIKRFILSVFTLFFVLNFSTSSFATTKEIIEKLVDENRVLSSATELHLTSSDAPFSNSIVSLNHEDAWLFFDNIRPADVLANYISYIKINGEQLVNDINGRVAIYAHGTVVIPHGSNFTPLTVFTEDNFTGTTKQFAIHTYYNKLAELDNTIKSFRLKRGYAVTFATNADGSGYSRVFIADKNDIEFSKMPEELYGNISFIRIFKHEWVSKKGWCGWSADDIKMANVTCYYDWNVGGATSANFEYSPIRQKGGWPSWDDINAKLNVTHLLGFNEPDHTDQANLSFSEMISIWPGMLNSGLRIGSPAWANPWSGTGGNLFDFIKKCEELNYRVDFVALHCYWGGKSPINWYNDLKYIHETTGRPLWITEWNNGANWTTESWPDNSTALTTANAEKQLNDIKGILQVLDTAHFVERYFIYNWVEDRRAMILNGALTPAGKYYAENKSKIAYNSANEVIPKWNYTTPQLSYTYNKFTNIIRLAWVNGNGDLCKEFKIEKQINDGNFETIYTSSDVTEYFYTDALNTPETGTISYRISFLSNKGTYLTSNEVKYHQTSGTNEIQIGKFKVNSTDWGISIFSKTFASVPLVILGAPTFNNLIPLTTRVANVSTKSLSFHLDAWEYLNSPTLTKTDVIPSLILKSGVYNFGGLKAEANSVSTVSREWKTVTFTQEFTEPPIVFATVASYNTLFPLTTAIQNITTTGFDVCVKSEEEITSLVSAETVNFIAVQQGEGSINGNRINVSRTTEGNGTTSMPLKISLDPTYTMPVAFAGLLTANDKFASTVRSSFSEAGYVKFIKHREISGLLTATNSDQLGWMVMDVAPNQVINSVETNKATNQYLVYPNPAEKVLYFNFAKPTRVEIFDITGQKKSDAIVDSQLDINSLPNGVYILRIDNLSIARFIKK